MKTKKMTYNLYLWLEQLHALDSWLDRDADDLKGDKFCRLRNSVQYFIKK